MLSPKRSVFSLFLAAVLTVVTIWMMVTPMVGSGIIDEQNNLLFIPGATFSDAGVHLALIGEMKHRFPPTNFADSGAVLKNYHYLFDAGLALVAKSLAINSLDLYFRAAPLLLSGLLCLVIFLTIYKLTKSWLTAAFGIFISVFSTSLGFLMPSGANNVFMTDQIFDMMVNPQGVLSLIIFLTIFLLLESYEKSKKWPYLLGVTFLLAISFGIKAYGGIVFAFGVLMTAIFGLLRSKDYRLLFFLALGVVIMFIWVAETIDRSVVGLSYAPLWLLDHLVSDFEHLNSARLILFKEAAWQSGSYGRLIIFYLLAFSIYVVGSLGLRLVGLLIILKSLKNWRSIGISLVFLVGVVIVSFVIPLFFNQGRKPYDIVQFTPYFTLVMGITLTLVLHKKWWLMLLAVLIIIFMDKREILARMTTDDYQTKQVLRRPNHILARGSRIVVTKKMLLGIDYIKTYTPSSAIILLAPTNLNMSSLWFTSLAERRTVYSGLFFDYQVGKDTDSILSHWQKIFSQDDEPVAFDYAFLETDEIGKYDLIEGKYSLNRVYSNDEVVVYKRNTRNGRI